jgi:hypothetical protein
LYERTTKKHPKYRRGNDSFDCLCPDLVTLIVNGLYFSLEIVSKKPVANSVTGYDILLIYCPLRLNRTYYLLPSGSLFFRAIAAIAKLRVKSGAIALCFSLIKIVLPPQSS